MPTLPAHLQPVPTGVERQRHDDGGGKRGYEVVECLSRSDIQLFHYKHWNALEDVQAEDMAAQEIKECISQAQFHSCQHHQTGHRSYKLRL